MPREPGDAAPGRRDDACDNAQRASSSTSSLPSLEALVSQRRRSHDPDTHRDTGHDRSARPTERTSAERAPAVPRGPSSVIQQTPKVLVLDLDETLIHSKLRSGGAWHLLGSAYGGARDPEAVGARSSSRLLSFLGLGTSMRAAPLATSAHARLQPTVIEVTINGRSVYYQVYKRPWVDYFLRKVASWYQVVIFTASMQEYADPVIDWLDGGQGLISGRLFRESCTLRDGSYLKDLTVVDRDLRRVCLVDNSPVSYVLQEANGIPVEGWTHDPSDVALLDLLPILDGLRYATDVRHILGLRGFL
ncbi:protein-serine/threonine phosphatase [Malassezia obtusa]|uniref:Protein-serine/threonine phosphatase n=1 Tax=Malassezia obtusa TaxID=76774 RepID=A0AAF0E172_9BASI|nr:protein-serine/threonine phosphatase [Malassezia obtusa]